MSDILRTCVHTHTSFCDGADAPAALVQAALALDFVSLGFSGHGAASYDSASMTLEEVLAVMDAAEAAGKTTVRLHTGAFCLPAFLERMLEEVE